MSPLAAWELLKHGRKWLTLLAVLIAAATVYVWWQAAARDRDSLIAAADNICAASGASFRPEKVKPEAWGKACLAEVTRLRAFELGVANASAAELIEAMERRDGKAATDAALAAEFARRTNQHLLEMEKADAAVQGDRVGGDWAVGLNNLGRLRDPR